ncbi:MAG: response regulator transcription factor [Chloroflexi bacterium]|nr:response regulator transcription factor [Chloroflexota bacterium]
MEKKIKVLVVDDHAMVREGISLLLKAHPDMEVVGEATDGSEALEKVTELCPDVVLMDITMPKMSGLEATQQIKKVFPEMQVLALTVHGGAEYFFRILAAGASGYILKGGTSAELVTAIRALHQGGVYLHPSVAGKLVNGYLRGLKSGEERVAYDGLTEREREVLKLIGEGRTNQEIAELLFLSPNTVQTHRSRIMDKLGLHTRAELVKYAINKGLIDISS